GGTLDLSALPAGKRAEPLIDLLNRWLGREAAHPLEAETIADDLGFDSEFGRRHVSSLAVAVKTAMAARPEYAKLIKKLWADFVGRAGGINCFDEDIYIRQIFLVTLSKLICANFIERHPLHSDEKELRAILDGLYFRERGRENLVEYDYFGWLQSGQALIDVAEDMQRGLRTFDFNTTIADDIFGQLLSQLIPHDRRVLLGQEWTPQWLAAAVARAAFDGLPPGVKPRFVDPCCFSGALTLEIVKLARASDPKATTGVLIRACT